jgi:hypothetical protein
MRVCPKTKVAPAECWCPQHCSDVEIARQRRVVGEARFEFKGGEALHVFLRSKLVDEEMSLCNLRYALPPAEVKRLAAKGHVPTGRCEQCVRTLSSRTPNARLKRYLATKPSRR